MDMKERSRAGFKAYDIRGIVPTEVDSEIAYLVGRAYAQKYGAKRVAVGYDIRESSPELAYAVSEGLMDGGTDVLDIGMCGTEMVYFATAQYDLDGGIMVTASHNPINYNGLKLVREQGIPISADTGLKDIERMVFETEFGAAGNRGHKSELDIQDAYISTLLRYIKPKELNKFHIVANAGNGGARIAVDDLRKKLPFTWHGIYMNIDSTFSHGVPNPMIPENRKITMDAVIEEKADMGIAWDGDFDRCFFVDEKGSFIEGYYVLGILAKHFLSLQPATTIVHDPRLYWNTQAICQQYGGIPVESKGGHAFMKETMRQVDALYGAEMSAHHFFRDYSYCDSGMIPWLIVAEMMTNSGKKLSELVGEMEEQFPCSGEINRHVKNVDAVLAAVEKNYGSQVKEIKHLDGLSLDMGDWRFNLRPSNTEPVIRLNLETRGNFELMEQKRDEVLDIIDHV